MAFDVISIVYISIFVLAVLIGLKRGFLKTLVSFIKGIGAFFIATFLCKPLGTLLTNSKVGSTIAVKISDYLVAKGGIFTVTITAENKDILLSNALKEANIPSVLHDFISSLLIVPSEGTVNMGNALGLSVTYYICLGISFVMIFVLGLIFMILISKIFSVIEQIPFVGLANRLLGAAVSGVIGLLMICLISYAITLIIPLGNQLSLWFVDTLRLNDVEVFTISKYFYENNFLIKIITFIQNLFTK